MRFYTSLARCTLRSQQTMFGKHHGASGFIQIFSMFNPKGTPRGHASLGALGQVGGYTARHADALVIGSSTRIHAYAAAQPCTLETDFTGFRILDGPYFLQRSTRGLGPTEKCSQLPQFPQFPRFAVGSSGVGVGADLKGQDSVFKLS